jgi:hypothetical protein
VRHRITSRLDLRFGIMLAALAFIGSMIGFAWTSKPAGAQPPATSAHASRHHCHRPPAGMAAYPKSGFGYTMSGVHALVNFDQTDPCWAIKPFGGLRGFKSMAAAGCCPSSLAMVADTLAGKNWLPTDLARRYRHGVVFGGNAHWRDGRGGVDYLAKAGHDMGLSVRKVGPHRLKLVARALQHGALAIAIFGPGHFTNAGHCVVLRAANHRGIYVADPYRHGEKGNNENRAFGLGYLASQGLEAVWIYQPRQP